MLGDLLNPNDPLERVVILGVDNLLGDRLMPDGPPVRIVMVGVEDLWVITWGNESRLIGADFDRTMDSGAGLSGGVALAFSLVPRSGCLRRGGMLESPR